MKKFFTCLGVALLLAGCGKRPIDAIPPPTTPAPLPAAALEQKPNVPISPHTKPSIKAREYSFDDCGPWAKYSTQTWEPSLRSKLEPLTETTLQSEVEQEVVELCYSKSAQVVVGIVGPGYFKLGDIFKYEIQEDHLELANTELAYPPDRRLSALRSFGKRIGAYIEVSGGDGDGGYFTQATYHYYYDDNILELVRLCDNNLGGSGTEEFSDKATNCANFSDHFAAQPSEAPQGHAQSLVTYYHNIQTGVYDHKNSDSGEKPNPDYVVIEQVIIDDCGPNPDGICGWPLYIVGPKEWDQHDTKQEFYLGRTAGSGAAEWTYPFKGQPVMLSNHFGPFNDYLKQIVEEARRLKTITVDPAV